MLTRGLLWAALALFVYFLLTRLRSVAMLVGTRRGLREAAALRIRPSRIVIETFATGAILGLWATNALSRGNLDWEVGGSGSPLHLKLAGLWFIVGALLLAAGVGVLVAFAGFVAFARAEELREWLPRSVRGRPRVLRLAVMNPDVVFIAQRRSPLLWVWAEARAAVSGVLTTLALAELDHELPGGGWDETVGEASDEFELDERLGQGRRALTWTELVAVLSAVSGRAPADPTLRRLPTVELPTGGRAAGALLGLFGGAMKTRRQTRNRRLLMGFDERTNIRLILKDAPGTLAATYLDGDLDGLLHHARGAAFDELKPRLPGRQSRQLAKAYRRDGMEGAAAWMIENVPSYPELFQRNVCAELNRQASLVDSILSDF